MIPMKSRNAVTCLALLVLALGGCHTPTAKPQTGSDAAKSANPLFADVTLAAGITNTHHKPILDHQIDNINSWVSSVGAAAATADLV